jgi:2'-5' RNA ligase
MQRLYVVSFPEIAARDAAWLEALRAAHDPQGYALLRAHFTFVFGWSDGCGGDVVESEMRSVARGMGAIEFCLSRLVLSTHGNLHCVFLCPDQGSTEMFELHRKLHAGPLATCLDPSEQFTPHLTVCKTTDREHAERVVNQLRCNAFHITGTLAALSLGAMREGKFELLRKIALTGGERI